MFKQLNTRLRLWECDNSAVYAEFLPAGYAHLMCDPSLQPVHAQPASAAAPAIGASTASLHAAAADSTRPHNFDAVLTRVISLELGEDTAEQLCEELWPSPTPAAWAEIQTLAAQVAVVLNWMRSSSHRSKAVHSDHASSNASREAYKGLMNSLFQLLRALLVGHLSDMSLDTSKVFCNLFSTVMQSWAESARQPSAHSEGKPGSLLDEVNVRQLGQAFLRRLTVDEALAQTFLCPSIAQLPSLMAGVKAIFSMLGGSSSYAACICIASTS